MVPIALTTMHCSDGGLFTTVTSYGCPITTFCANVNGRFALPVNMSVPLSARVTGPEPDRPEILPPTVNDGPVGTSGGASFASPLPPSTICEPTHCPENGPSLP